MKYGSAVLSSVFIWLAASSSLTPFGKQAFAELNGEISAPMEMGMEMNFTPPSDCYEAAKQTGQPVRFFRDSAISQPVLVTHKPVAVPAQPVAGRNFYCATFHYSVDEQGNVVDVSTLYNSHDGLANVGFAKQAKKTLRDWRYQPGMVDRNPAKFTGLTTVFFHAF